jgi:CRISPR-associated protein Csy2
VSQFLVLSKVRLQNANSIAGFTWGFPAITQFLGFTHALSRKLSSKFDGEYDTELSGCMVVANQVNNKVYQPKAFADFEFLQSKNPPVLAKHKSASPPIIEEGKLNATISLVIELKDSLLLTSEQITAFEGLVKRLCLSMRIAGGTVLDIAKVQLFSANTAEDEGKQLKQIKRLCMPGFVLQDRSEYLKKQVTETTQDSFSAWLEFIALKAKAEPKLANELEQPTEKTAANWQYQPKPFSGYLVPLMTGYKSISDDYKEGQVEDVRDPKTPARFVEAVHSVGEWLSMHRVVHLSDYIWRYDQQGVWYLCQQQPTEKNAETEFSDEQLANTELFNNLF